MASLNPDQEEQQNNQQPGAGNPVTVGGTAGASASGGQGGNAGNGVGGAAPQSPVAQNQSPAQNGSYTDVATYLNANQGGAKQLGQQVASNLTNKYNDTKTGVTQSANDLINQVNHGYTAENKDLISQTAANPNAAASDPNQVSQFQAQLNDTYTGPNSWGDYGTQQGKVAQAQQYGSLANTPGGYNVYTQELEGPTASQGVNQLDSMLLQGSPEAAGAVKAAADPYSTLNGFLDQQNQSVTGAIGTGQTAAKNASQDALNAFTGANGTLTNLNSSINSRAANALQTAQGQNSSVLAALKGLYSRPEDTTATTLHTYGGGTTPWLNSTNYAVGNLDPQSLSTLGINSDQWGALQGAMQQAGTTQAYGYHNFGADSPTAQIDLSQWLDQQNPAASVNAGTVANKADYDQMAAISKLLGDKTPTGNAIDPTQAALAGTAPTSFNQFNYQDALNAAQSTAAAERQMAQDAAGSLGGQADAQHAAEKSKGVLNTIKNAVKNPGKALALDPRNAYQTLKNATKGKDPTGQDPLPSKDELHKLGIKS